MKLSQTLEKLQKVAFEISKYVQCTSPDAVSKREREREWRPTVTDILLAEAKVSEYNVSRGIQENVLRFQVSVYYVQVVEVAQCRGYLRRIEPDRQRERNRQD